MKKIRFTRLLKELLWVGISALLIAWISLFSLRAYANKYVNYPLDDSQFAKQFLKYKKPCNQWKVSLGTYTLNDKIISNIEELKLGADISVQYDFNKNLYASTKINYESLKKIGWDATIGVQGSGKVLRPYIEVNYNQIPVENKKALRLVGYDVGVNLVLNKYISPYFQVDNFTQRNREGFSTGINVTIKNIVMGLGYTWNTQSHNDSANIEVGYLF